MNRSAATAVTILGLALLAPVGCRPAKDSETGSDLDDLKRRCGKGNRLACLKVGTAHAAGIHAPQSPAEAARFFGRACELGAGEGCFHQANLRMQSAGKDAAARDEALKLFARACELKVALGCYRVGASHYQGESGKRDFDRAIERFRQACDLGDARSCFFVGTAFREGRELPRSDPQAVAYLRKACDLGNGSGCFGLGMMMDKGLGGLKPDPSIQRQLLQKACDGGVVAACTSLQESPPAGTAPPAPDAGPGARR
jgi:hypothetical protein